MRDNGVPRPLSRPLIITKIFVSETAPVFHSFNVKNSALGYGYYAVLTLSRGNLFQKWEALFDNEVLDVT